MNYLLELKDLATRVTPDMLKEKIVLDADNQRVGKVIDIVREVTRSKLSLDYLVIELDKRVKIGQKQKVKVRAQDAKILADGSIQVIFTKEKLKTMIKEEELRKHPPTV